MLMPSLSLLQNKHHELPLLTLLPPQCSTHYAVYCVHELLFKTDPLFVGQLSGVLDIFSDIFLVGNHKAEPLEDAKEGLGLSWLEVVAVDEVAGLVHVMTAVCEYGEQVSF